MSLHPVDKESEHGTSTGCEQDAAWRWHDPGDHDDERYLRRSGSDRAQLITDALNLRPLSLLVAPETLVMRHVTQHCNVGAEDGAVILECGHALVSLEPRVAKVAATKMAWVADVADAQGILPPGENECGEDETSA